VSSLAYDLFPSRCGNTSAPCARCSTSQTSIRTRPATGG
jgi:hypothetical protein